MRSQTSSGSQINIPSSCLTTLVFLRSIKFTVGQGKEGIIDFTPGSELIVAKAKNGHLSVVRQPNALVFAVKKILCSHENVGFVHVGWSQMCSLVWEVLWIV